MHALALVVIPPDGNVDDHLAAILARFDENASPDGWYDWYQVGGRYTGTFDDAYDPRTDPANVETCDTCAGTGTRDWTGCDVTPERIAECNGCNACHGIGSRLKWPTDWADHPGDVVTAPVAVAYARTRPDGCCHTIVAGETVLQREVFRWDDVADNGEWIVTEDFDAKVLEALSAADPTWRVVAVDFHS